ncbi:hypothetical protein B0H21DRAFT_35772 [Amylocystis lapponica]|nr:hypothetical protein B0H21DRAFT_35772 [Amylocystis lapponica]
MPTVPSTCRSLSSLADEGFIVSRLDSHIPDDRGRPTPDPELDDMVLIPADTGDAVSSSDQELPLPPVHSDHPAKPHITLENLILHSPSSIVGTPFDLSPRFEYPFPSSPSEPNMFMPYSASLHNIPSLLDVGFATSLSTATLPLSAGPRTRADPRGYSPTHPKLHPRDPPVPPGLAKKRRITGAIASARARPRGDSVPLPGADGRDARWPRPSAEAVRLKRASLERTSSDETVVSSVCPDIKVDLVGSVELEVAVEIAPTLAVEDEVAGARVLVQTRGGQDCRRWRCRPNILRPLQWFQPMRAFQTRNWRTRLCARHEICHSLLWIPHCRMRNIPHCRCRSPHSRSHRPPPPELPGHRQMCYRSVTHKTRHDSVRLEVRPWLRSNSHPFGHLRIVTPPPIYPRRVRPALMIISIGFLVCVTSRLLMQGLRVHACGSLPRSRPHLLYIAHSVHILSRRN